MNNKILCPVCKLEFNNNYCLSNHIFKRGNKKFFDKDHKKYWFEKKQKDKEQHNKELKNKIRRNRCRRCKKLFLVDFEHRFKKRCDQCNKEHPRRIKIKKKQYETKIVKCKKCEKKIIVRLFSCKRICDDCRYDEIKEKQQIKLKKPLISNCSRCGEQIIKYKNHLHDHGARRICDNCKNNKYWYKGHEKYDEVIKLLSTTDLTRREIVNKLDLSHDFVRDAAIDKFGKNWYNNRLKKIGENARIKGSKSIRLFYQKLRLNKKKFNHFFEKRNLGMNPSSVEKKFVSDINYNNVFDIETNKWLTLKINGKYERREIDVKIKISNKKFAIFIDGEAFHGKNAKSCFNHPSIQRDSAVAFTLAEKGYFSIRYSETEVKSDWAKNHFLQLYEEFKKNEPKFYYKNWMTNEEIVKYA